MLFKKFCFVIIAVAFTLSLGSAVVTEAAPLLQEEAEVETADGENGEENGTNNSTGDTIDLSSLRPNLGTVMSGKYQGAGNDQADGDTGDDDGSDSDSGDNGDTNDEDDEEDMDDTNGDDDSDDNEDEDSSDDDVAAAPEHPVARALSNFFGVEYEEVFDLHQAGNGFGNIAKAYFFDLVIDDADTTPADLLMEVRGSGWGNVLKEKGIHPGAVGRGIQPAPEQETDVPSDSDDANQDSGDAGALSNDIVGNSADLMGPGGGNGQAKGHPKFSGKDKDKGVKGQAASEHEGGNKGNKGNKGNNGNKGNKNGKGKGHGKGKK